MATTTIPQYRIQVRDNTLTPLGEITSPLDGDLVLNFNDVSQWVVTVRADSPMAPYFVKGNGIIISRDRGDGTGAQTILSGPIWHFERRLLDNVYVLAGPDDLWWLKARRADPVTGAGNYANYVNTLPGLLRYYKFGEASGTTATDSKSAINGTYNGGFTLGQPAVADDSATTVLLNGTSGYMTAATTSLPSGNSSIYLAVWVYLSALPTSSAVPFFYGNTAEGTRTGIFLQVQTNGTLLAKADATTATTAAGFLAPGVPHLVGAQWDGTNLTCWLDGVQIGTVAPGALSLGTTALRFGTKFLAQFWPGYLGHAVVGSGTLTAAQWQSLYALGISHYDQQAYDTRTNTASTVIRGYVNDNAGPGALASRRVFGLALAADPAIGSSTTGNARFDNLLALIQQLALSGGDIGFKLVQTDVGVLTFSLYQPATQSNAIFSRELGNLLDAVYTLDGPVANQYVIGGGGEGVLRIFETGQDNASMSAWGLVEGFLDARDTSDLPTLQQRIAAQLAQDAQQTNLSITPVDTPALTFGRDYGLGDIVSVQIDGTTITDKIRQLHIQLNSTDQELITPGIGNAGAGQIAALFDAQQRALAAVQTQLARLQAAQ